MPRAKKESIIPGEMSECLFCKIVNKEISTQLVRETQNAIVFKDIMPKAPTHILITPKKHIETFLDLKDQDKEIFEEMKKVAQELIREKRLPESGYQLIFNGGRYQHVPHLHWHLLGDS